MRENRFKEALLNPSVFPATWNWCREGVREKRLKEKRPLLWPDGRSRRKNPGPNRTDNPGGTPAMSADFMGGEIVKTGH